jgi:hypothetical protein
MKFSPNWQSWIINGLAAAGTAGGVILAVNSPALPKSGIAWIVVFFATTFAANLANSMNRSVLQPVSSQADSKNEVVITEKKE